MNFFTEQLKLEHKKISERIYGNIEPTIDQRKKTLVVFTGMVASGKTSIAEILETKSKYKRVKTATTREKRPHEKLHDYVFMRPKKPEEKTSEYYQALVQEYDLIEHDEHYGYLYGIPRKSIEELLSRDIIPIVLVDFEGAETLSKKLHTLNKIFITILPDTIDQIVKRLEHRHTDYAELEERVNEDLRNLQLSKRYTNFYILNSEVKIGNTSGLDIAVQFTNNIIQSALEASN